MTSDGATTMAGFQWSPTSGYVPAEAGEDGWCVRDAVCQLLDWQPGSENWRQFVESPQGADTPRLADRLGLTCLQVPQDWNELIARLDHPGMAIFDFHIYQKSHAIYVKDLRWLLHHWPTVDGKPAIPEDRPLRSFGWLLGVQYMERDPTLGAVLIDERQPPHAVV